MKKRKLKAQPVSSRQDKINFIRANARRIIAVQNDADKTAQLVIDLANEMLAQGLYLKTTAKTDRCRTVHVLIQEMGFWEDDIVRRTKILLWQRNTE